jgi:hypothetical protein
LKEILARFGEIDRVMHAECERELELPGDASEVRAEPAAIIDGLGRVIEPMYQEQEVPTDAPSAAGEPTVETVLSGEKSSHVGKSVQVPTASSQPTRWAWPAS